MIGLSFRFCFLLRQSCFHLIVSDGFISGIRRKWKRSDSSDLDSVVPMTPLMTPIFDFHKFIRAHMTLYFSVHHESKLTPSTLSILEALKLLTTDLVSKSFFLSI